MLALLLLGVVAQASILKSAIYTSLNGSTTCTRLLDEFGEIGCSCLMDWI